MEKRTRKRIAQEGLHIVRRTDAQEIVADALGLSGQPTTNAMKEALVNWARAVVRRGGESIQHDALAKYVSSVVESVDNPKHQEAVRKYLVDLLSGTKVDPKMEHAKRVKELIAAARDALASHTRAKAQAKPERTIGEAAFSYARAIRNNARRRGLGNKYAAFRQIEALERSAAQRKSQGLDELVKKAYGIILPEKVVGTADESVDAVGELMKGRRSLSIEKTAQRASQVVAFLDEFEKGNITNPREYAEKNLTPAERASLGKFLKFYGSYNKTARELARQLGTKPTATEETKQQQAETETKSKPSPKPAGGQTEEKTPSEQVPQPPAGTGAGKRGAEKMASQIKSISKQQLQKLTVNEALAALESGRLGKHSLSVDAAKQLAQAVVTALGNRLPPEKAGGIDVAPNKDFFKSWVSEVRGTLSTDAEALALKLGQPAAAQQKKTSGKGGTGEKAAPKAKPKTADTGESAPPQTAEKPKEPEAKVEIKEEPKVAAEKPKEPEAKVEIKREDKKINIREALRRTGHLDEKGRFISKRGQQPQQIKPGTVVLTEQQLKFLLRLGKRPGNEPLNKMIDDLWRGTKGKTEIPKDVMNKLMASGPRLVRRQAKLAQPKPESQAPTTTATVGVEPKPVAEISSRVSPVSETTVEAAPKGRLGTLRGIAPHALTFIGAVALTKLLEALSERKKPAEIPAFPQPQVPQQGVWQQPIFPMFPMPQQFLPQQNQQQIPMFQTLPIIGPPAVINLEAFQ